MNIGPIRSKLLLVLAAVTLAAAHAQPVPDAESLRKKAEAAIEARNWSEATVLVDRLMALRPDPGLRMNLCWALIRSRVTAEARSQCQSAFDLAPKALGNTVNLGHVHLLEGDEAGARRQFDQAIALGFDKAPGEVVADLSALERDGWPVDLLQRTSMWMRGRLAQWEKVLQAMTAMDSRPADGIEQVRAALGRHRQFQSLAEGELGPDNILSAFGQVSVVTDLMMLGQYQEALVLARRAAPVFAKSDAGVFAKGVIGSMLGLSLALGQLGNYSEALPIALKTLALSENLLGTDSRATQVSMRAVAVAYRRLGACDRTIPYIERVRSSVARQFGPDSRESSFATADMAACLGDLGRLDEAIALSRQALGTLEASKERRPFDARPLVGKLADLLMAAGQLDIAMSTRERELLMLREEFGPGHPFAASSMTNLAFLKFQAGDREAAGQLFQSALQSVPALQDPQLRFGILRAVARYDNASGQRATAIFFGKQAVNTIQSIRLGAGSLDKDLQSALLEDNKQIYQDLASWLIDDGRFVEAEQVLAMLKSQEFFELTRDASATQAAQVIMTGPEVAAEREYQALLGQIAADLGELETLNRLAATPGGGLSADQAARRTDLRDAQKKTQNDFQRFLGRLSPTLSSDPNAVANERGRLRDSAVVLQSALRPSNQGSQLRHVALTYVVTRDKLSILVATADGAFARQIELKPGELNGYIGQMRDVLRNPRLDPRPVAQSLYRILLGPIESDLRALAPQVLVLSLNGVLRYIPFAALHDGERYLVQRYAVVLYPSQGFRGVQPVNAQGWQVTGMGTTRSARIDDVPFDALPAVVRELSGIVRTERNPQGAMPGQVLLDDQFTRDAFEQALDRARIGKGAVVHVASHYQLSPRSADASFLVLGNGKPLGLDVLAQMDFNGVQLLTLSACNTASQGERNDDGSEVEGLAGAAQLRGAQSVMATLWPVADATTGRQMQRFYQIRTLAAVPMTNALALQKTQLELLTGQLDVAARPGSEPAPSRAAVAGAATTPPSARARALDFVHPPNAPFAHPYYWAPFVLMGNWL